MEIQTKKFYHHKIPVFLKDVNNEQELVSKKISSGQKPISTLLVTCMIVRKLNHYI